MEIKTRRQAAESGQSQYYTGKPCNKGHDGPRYTASGICCKCNALASKAYNNKMRFVSNNIAADNFIYNLHPADHAAAEAYCQALDMQRGIKPSKQLKRQQAPHPHSNPAEAIQRTRTALLLDNAGGDLHPTYMPKP